MNEIELRVERDENGSDWPVVAVWIDGRELADAAVEVESAWYVAQGRAPGGPWGGGLWDPAEWAALLAYRATGTPVVACGCGESGCGSVDATITADAATVTWTFSSGLHEPLGPLTFDRGRYEAAVRAVVDPLLLAHPVVDQPTPPAARLGLLGRCLLVPFLVAVSVHSAWRRLVRATD